MSVEGKRLLVLGGSPFQVPLIERAKKRGLYVITCDYLPDNPGHQLADEYHNVSTTDREAVLALAKALKIDAITSFSSDPAVPTVAHVAHALGLPGPLPSAVEVLTEKDRFRTLMRQLGMSVPDFFSVREAALPEGVDSACRYIVKPVDSSGSKGITLSDGTAEGLQKCIEYALGFSRVGRCVIEGFVEGKQIHGDGFLRNGKLVYHYLGDHYFYTDTNSFVPISTRWPTSVSDAALNATVHQVESIARASGYMDGPVNIEARVNNSEMPFIIEVAPRNGGNFVPIIQHHLTGFDFVGAVKEYALGGRITAQTKGYPVPGGHYIFHSTKKCRFDGVEFSPEIEKQVFFSRLFKMPGECVDKYMGSNNSIGVCLLHFDSIEHRDMLMNKATSFLRIILVDQ